MEEKQTNMITIYLKFLINKKSLLGILWKKSERKREKQTLE